MKKKVSIILLAILMITSSLTVRADEGMWLLNMIGKNYKQMKAQGFRLKPEDIYSIKHSSLKDAIVDFGDYCTGEIVSDQGLLFTNHHCGYQSIQQHSSIDHNYLKDGFWAQSFEQEIPTPGLFVCFMEEIRDVTTEILNGVTDNMDENKRQATIQSNIKKETENAQKEFKEDYYRIEIESFFVGNAYYLIIYTKYDDVRLVGTAPESIGKFGHDTDNWMWPRHTGDFSIFRVYMSPDGKPAQFSQKNIPLKPKHFLPISIQGYKEGDFAMIIGFPGSTERHSTSYEIINDIEIGNKIVAEVRGIRQDILKADMEADEDIRIKYSSKFSNSSNYWKKSIEANKSLASLNIIGKKQAEENSFTQWINQKSERKAIYGNVLSDIENVCKQTAKYDYILSYVNECVINGMEFFMPTYQAMQLLSEDNKESVLNQAEEHFKDYNKPTDYKASKRMAQLLVEKIDKEEVKKILANSADEYIDQLFSNPDAIIDTIFEKSIFVSKEKSIEFINNPGRGVLTDDPAFEFVRNMLNIYFSIRSINKQNGTTLSAAHRLYTKGVNEMNSKALSYSDANFTERLTYGTVQKYISNSTEINPNGDGVLENNNGTLTMNYFCTLKGVMEKEKPGDFEFDVAPKLKTLYQNKDYGQYADQDGTMHVCFLTNNDITGGNSGSPVIDGKGRLIGLAFDGNSESMCSDWFFNPELQRCINVDIRYVLFVIEKFGECKRIINELSIEK
ncbi:MAG: S46 family peptidase [Bacteroidales bacterium]|nr:S46 family peptidase [Bacteroidales bacterium]